MGKAAARDLIAFWILGLSNNYAFVIMLSAAGDIITRQKQSYSGESIHSLNPAVCQEEILSRKCNKLSTGAILIANIVPALFIKLVAPFFIHRIPFGIRHAIVCIFQVISLIIVASSTSIAMSLVGVCFASAGSGLGEACYLALSAHYHKDVVSMWSSGTGGAGIVGAFSYAFLTEPRMIGMTPRQALLSMLIVPVVFALAYWSILTASPTIHKANILEPRTWIVPKQSRNVADLAVVNHNENEPDSSHTWSIKSTKRIHYVKPLMRYMIPLVIVYFAEYMINQGVVELFIFDCSHGFGLSLQSQYRWYQVLYQVGVFISRSSINLIELSTTAIYMLPVLQMLNLVIFVFNAIYGFIPHIGIVFTFILFEGFFGGASYVNTFNRIHREAPPEGREFCLLVATLSDTVGTMFAGIGALPLHNAICSMGL